eukprot:1535299-Prymnesium_polylepis.1
MDGTVVQPDSRRWVPFRDGGYADRFATVGSVSRRWVRSPFRDGGFRFATVGTQSVFATVGSSRDAAFGGGSTRGSAPRRKRRERVHRPPAATRACRRSRTPSRGSRVPPMPRGRWSGLCRAVRRVPRSRSQGAWMWAEGVAARAQGAWLHVRRGRGCTCAAGVAARAQRAWLRVRSGRGRACAAGVVARAQRAWLHVRRDWKARGSYHDEGGDDAEPPLQPQLVAVVAVLRGEVALKGGDDGGV